MKYFQLFVGLTPSEETTTASQIYAAWSLIHLIRRMSVVALIGTRIATYGHQVGQLIAMFCPPQYFSPLVNVHF